MSPMKKEEVEVMLFCFGFRFCVRLWNALPGQRLGGSPARRSRGEGGAEESRSPEGATDFEGRRWRH